MLWRWLVRWRGPCRPPWRRTIFDLQVYIRLHGPASSLRGWNSSLRFRFRVQQQCLICTCDIVCQRLFCCPVVCVSVCVCVCVLLILGTSLDCLFLCASFFFLYSISCLWLEIKFPIWDDKTNWTEISWNGGFFFFVLLGCSVFSLRAYSCLSWSIRTLRPWNNMVKWWKYASKRQM